jgi:Kef-type K+ transport system membrane component KefB
MGTQAEFLFRQNFGASLNSLRFCCFSVQGLETDFSLFLRFGLPAFVVAMGGVIFPFFFGVFLTIAFGYANSVMHPSALFMGAVMTATSVGITARVLSELGRLGTPKE